VVTLIFGNLIYAQYRCRDTHEDELIAKQELARAVSQFATTNGNNIPRAPDFPRPMPEEETEPPFLGVSTREESSSNLRIQPKVPLHRSLISSLSEFSHGETEPRRIQKNVSWGLAYYSETGEGDEEESGPISFGRTDDKHNTTDEQPSVEDTESTLSSSYRFRAQPVQGAPQTPMRRVPSSCIEDSLIDAKRDSLGHPMELAGASKEQRRVSLQPPPLPRRPPVSDWDRDSIGENT